MKISKAERKDLKKILELQYLAYQSEAMLLNDYNIQPLRQTLEEVEREFDGGVILKALDEKGEIVGSVRGRVSDGTLYVGKLIVHPACQGKGIGTSLLREIERVCPQPRCELFTSSKSVRNLGLYERVGYRRFKEEAVSPELKMIFLEKTNSKKSV